MRKYKPITLANRDLTFTPHYIQWGDGRRIYNRGLSKRYVQYLNVHKFLTTIFWEWIRKRTYPWRVLGMKATENWDRREVWDWREKEILKYIKDWRPYVAITSTSLFTSLVPSWLQKKTRKALSVTEEMSDFLHRVGKRGKVSS